MFVLISAHSSQHSLNAGAPGGASVPHGPLLQTLAAGALTICILSAIVLMVRGAQLLLDNRMATRARQVAQASSCQRLRVLAERRRFYAPPGTGAGSTPRPSIDLPEDPPAYRERDIPSSRTSLSASDAAPPSTPGASQRSSLDRTHPRTAYGLNPGSGPGAGAPVTDRAVRAFLRERRPTLTAAFQSPFDTLRSGSANFMHSGASSGPLSTAAQSAAHSFSGAALQQWQGEEGMVPPTSQVLGSVPLDTIISTRSVLESFKYDYAELQKMEASIAERGRLRAS